MECREWTDAQLGNNDSANDVRDVNLTLTHMLSGPVEIEGAEPGDLLVVDLLELGPVQPPQARGDAPGQGWGYTGIFAKVNGGGFLTDHFPEAYKAIWDFHGQDATSRHIPGVRYTGITHPGLAGTAPSARLLAEWNRREQALIDTDPNRVPPLGLPPLEDGLLAGTLSGQELRTVGREGARTVPGRENGGNMDIKNFTRGSRVYYPVFVPGAKFSIGDLHFSQGDGEITFCGAIEMGGYVDLGVDLIKDGMNKYGVQTSPVLIPGRVDPQYSEFLTFTGVSVHETSGQNYYMDATVAYRRACLNAIEYLKKFGYSGEQAYLLIGSAPIEGRISGIVDIPNACCSLYLPTAIFDFDVRPNRERPQMADRGSAAKTS
jgi:formamidase